MADLKGRGSANNPDPRFLEYQRKALDDGWGGDTGEQAKVRTQYFKDHSKTIISRNQSPDVPFELSINPYKGCEHGCCYCFARPTHAYLDLSPGLDFETKIYYKPDAARLLELELRKKSHRVSPIALGANTDAYQPLERKLGITRSIITVLKRFHHPFVVISKSVMIERDLDLLVPMAKDNLVKVVVSLTTLDKDLSRRLEPRAAAPSRRLQLIRTLEQAGIPVGILVAPIVPMLNDSELEELVKAGSEAGAQSASFVMLRLPHELKDLFSQWLERHYPLKAERVMNRVRDMHGGREYNARWGERMRGKGNYVEMISQRFRLVCRQCHLNRVRFELNTRDFCLPDNETEFGQLSLF